MIHLKEKDYNDLLDYANLYKGLLEGVISMGYATVADAILDLSKRIEADAAPRG